MKHCLQLQSGEIINLDHVIKYDPRNQTVHFINPQLDCRLTDADRDRFVEVFSAQAERAEIERQPIQAYLRNIRDLIATGIEVRLQSNTNADSEGDDHDGDTNEVIQPASKETKKKKS